VPLVRTPAAGEALAPLDWLGIALVVTANTLAALLTARTDQ
jgi:hypothetical protein